MKEPRFITDPDVLPVLQQLSALEPIFHTDAYRDSAGDLSTFLDPDFWEVGASGRRYSREFILEELGRRGEIHAEPTWRMDDLWCREVGPETYVVTYTLSQDNRITRRATIWRRSIRGWQIVYHQGTIVQEKP